MLVALVVAIYAQVYTHSFINFDDPDYVSNNPNVRAGLRWSGVQWAFTHVHASNWHPLTWLSHMVDVQLFGQNAGAHLLVSMALHALNSVLVFFFLRMATGALWRSATVAALFAVHPLHVESVAWISERKDTLSALFFLLCLIAYVRFALTRSRGSYLASVLALAMGLMAKPMLVTTPFVLLLLDAWPLRRLELSTLKQRLIEKIPFALCVVPSVAATLFAQREAMPSVTIPPLPRLANAAISYVAYLVKTFWPTGLSVMYPFPTRIDPRRAIICGALVMAITAVTYFYRRTLPWLFVGWLWFVGMLIPVIGVVQVGVQSMADRYTYLPHIGLFVAIVWTFSYIVQSAAPQQQAIVAVITAALMTALAGVAYAQVQYWAGSIPLFEHAVSVTSNNKLAHVNLGSALLDAGDYEGAEREYRQAEGFKPALTVYLGLATALLGQGKFEPAGEVALKAVESAPKSAGHELAFGSNAPPGESALAQMFSQAIALDPSDSGLHNNLAAALARLGDDARALQEYQTALQLNPKLYDAHMNYGALLSRLGRDTDAGRQFAEAERLQPRSPEPHVYLALLNANRHEFESARREIELAIAADHDASNRLLINAIRIPDRPTAIDEYLAFLRRQSGGQ